MGCVCVGNGSPTVELASLLRHVVPSCPSLPYDMGLDLLRQAYIEAARKSGIIRHVCEITRQRGVTNYPLIPPEGFEVYAVVPLHRQAHSGFESPHTWGVNTDRYRIIGNEELELYSAPGVDGVTPMQLTVTLVPTDCTVTVLTEIATPFGKGIAAGALRDAMCMPNHPWSSPQLSAKHERTFYRTIADMRNSVITDRGALAPIFRPVRII